MPEPYDPYSYQACAHSLPNDGRYAYQLNPALGEGRRCGVSYTAEHLPKGDTITMNFRLIDHNLVVQDHEAANAQIDGKLNAEMWNTQSSPSV